MRMDGRRALGDCDVEDAGTVTQFGSRASARKSGNDARCACEDGGGIGGMGTEETMLDARASGRRTPEIRARGTESKYI